ncbi:MAG TPA: hypothetical protein VNZ58_06635 [Thermomicrobiales bacterium]|nr:hypothetical protein [Thermomicrobiales bacterium]
MPTLYLGMNREILIVNPARPEDATPALAGKHIAALATDPARPARVWCGTYGEGLLRSDDRGQTWHHPETAPDALLTGNVLSVAVSATDDVVYAGTEPSRLFRSDDGGDTWQKMESLQDLPSKLTWSFPPKPDTHHVRWITPHPTTPGELFVAIEAGAIVHSTDGGETWTDRTPDSPIDSHVVRIHPQAPDLVRSAAGDGCFESRDRGKTWSKTGAGLGWHYCYGLAIDSMQPDLALMSVAPSARLGHGGRGEPLAAIYRQEGDDPWQRVFIGLPADEGTTLAMIEADPGISRSFYAVNNRGLYFSEDGGLTWERLDVPWKDSYLDRRPAALAIDAS